MRLAILSTALALAALAVGAQQQAASDSARFVRHPDNIVPGIGAQAQRPAASALRDPLEGDPRAASDGAKLFVAYNCIDCHGADGSGAMGPSLADGRWRYGGTAGEVFQSIYEGRPDGMPAWGTRIGDDAIWRLVAYVRTLGAGSDVATENFTGETVERTGH
jgi:cytochrome c oxidase cbb3-type subunit 3